MILAEKRLSKKSNRSNEQERLFIIGLHELTKSRANLTRKRFELTSCSPLFQWVRNSNCCTGRMGQIVHQLFEEKKSSENIDETLGRRAARNKVIPFTIQDEPQAQIVSMPSNSIDDDICTGKLPRRERPKPDADYSRQEVIVEVHLKLNNGLPKKKIAESPT